MKLASKMKSLGNRHFDSGIDFFIRKFVVIPTITLYIWMHIIQKVQSKPSLVEISSCFCTVSVAINFFPQTRLLNSV